MPLDFATLEALQKGPRSVASERSRWYACRTRSRSEKAAARALERRNVECYLPLLDKRSRWADRTVTVSVPLFPATSSSDARGTRSARFLRLPDSSTWCG